MAALILAAAPAEPVRTDSDRMLREHVRSSGQVSKELAEQTGWSVLRGLRWRILLFNPADKQQTPVSPKTVFRTGQRVQVEIEAHVCDMWIYLLNVNPEGDVTVPFPERTDAHLLVRKGRTVVFPPRGDRLRFKGAPGKELLRIIASPKKLTWVNPKELDKLGQGRTLSELEAEAAGAQKAYRSKSLRALDDAQSRLPVETRSLPEVVAKMKTSPQFRHRCKNVSLVPPPQDTPSPDRQEDPADEILVAASDRENRDPIIVNVELEHR